MVFAWHFSHYSNGYPVPFEYVPNFFPLALLDEGHTGVALFMTLSGYLFAKLLDGKFINYPAFFWNRALRLLPLLFLVIFLVGIQKYVNSENIKVYVYEIIKVAVLPTLPNGGWSITVEFQYYLTLPVLFWMFRHSKFLPIMIVILAILTRYGVYSVRGEVQTFAYWTILGRIDQFALGMLFFSFRNIFFQRHGLILAIALIFSLFYWTFDLFGGFYQYQTYPSPSLTWVIMPTIEGLAYSAIIAWYEISFKHSTTGFSWFLGKIG